MNNGRPLCIVNYSDIQEADNNCYPGSDEKMSFGSPLGRHLGLKKIGIHHEILTPGRRTSFPHAESDEEEFVFVISGTPDAWIDGHLHPLKPGDAVGFPSGTGICHTIINNSDEDVRLMVVGEASKPENKIHYPFNPERKEQMGAERWWDLDVKEKFGPHDGKPKQR